MPALSLFIPSLMQRRDFLKHTSAAGVVALITPSGIIHRSDAPLPTGTLAENFGKPPASARAHTWWHWMNGNVTADGITRDLEAMQAIGLGGFQNFDAGTGIPKGPVVYLSPEWLRLKEHTIKEAGRLGLEFTMHNCPGWSSSGGPWITPDRAMQQLTWSETYLMGGQSVVVSLPQPFSQLYYYRDVRVLAFPSLPGERPLQPLLKQITSSSGPIAVGQLESMLASGMVIRPGDGTSTAFIQFEFNQPYQARSLSLVSSPVADKAAASNGPGAGLVPGGPGFMVEASDDGIQYRKLTSGSFGASPNGAWTLSEFPATIARFYRLTTTVPRALMQFQLSGVKRLDNWAKKTNRAFNGEPPLRESDGPTTDAIHPDAIVDLTTRMDAQGQLRWTPPAGNWTVLRLGYTPLGALNRSAPDTGIGLECDKYSREAITFHFDKMMAALLPTLGPLAKKGKVGLLIDSYEIGMQNWTPQFPQAFQQRMGYDLATYLPAMTGRIVGNADATERFLWDIRRAQADLMADNYYGQFRALCQQHDMIAYAEPYDRGPMEELQVGARVDTNMGEFWNGLSTLFQNNLTMRRTTKLAASIAHTNGQVVVGAEAYTGEPESARWQEYPFAMKALGDKMFTQGLNRMVFHRFAHQPHPTAQPGMTMGPWGIHFDRTTTWWPVGSAWLTYIARCQYMLQQGLMVADLAYFSSEDGGVYAKVEPTELNPMPPVGYDYDLINAETIRQKATVVLAGPADYRLRLPDGMSYRLLVLQAQPTMSLSLLRTIRTLVNQGLCVFGARPGRTPGLSDFPAGQAEFKTLVTELWGEETGPIDRRVGKGRVFWGQPIDAVLQTLGVRPDVDISARSGDAPITWIHRSLGKTEIYFLANQRRTTEELVCTFRVNGLQPERWDPNTGQTTPLAVYEATPGQVRVPLRLDPAGSAFVVFRKPMKGRRWQTVALEGQPVLTTRPFPAVARTLYPNVTNNFTISFWAKPELNVMLANAGFRDNVPDFWTDYYTIYPPPGEPLYGAGHETCGLAVGRNGVAVWQHSTGKPKLVLGAPVPLSGWSHIALVYQAGALVVFVNGQRIQAGKATSANVHPGVGQAFLSEGASYYNGDMTEPRLLPEALSDDQIRQLAAEPRPSKPEKPVIELAGHEKPALRFWQNGPYSLQNPGTPTQTLVVSGITPPIPLTAPWTVNFPPDLGAPAQITLAQLTSLHEHTDPGVRHFSGTATYRQMFTSPSTRQPGQRFFLDLSSVEVIAEVVLNGKNLGILWARPYRVDITDALKSGSNTLEIRVTNLWPNRLIGDEQLPDEAEYTPGAGASGFASLSSGAIQRLPDWYQQGKPKPPGGRVTFATWKHYTKDSPLLPSGLIGPVTIQMAVERAV